MKIFMLLSILFLLQPKLEKVYSKEDIAGYFNYAVIKQWELELKQQGTFILTYKKKDSRFKKVVRLDYIGTWVNKNDTIIFTSSSLDSSQYCFKTIEYVVSERKLKLIGFAPCLPESFEEGNRFTTKL